MARVAFPTDDEMLSATMLAAAPTDVDLPDDVPTNPFLSDLAIAMAMENESPADRFDRQGL